MNGSTTTTSSRTGSAPSATHVFSGGGIKQALWFVHVGNFHHWVALGVSLFVALMVIGAVWAYLKDRVNRGAEASTAGLNYVVGPMGSGKSMFGVRTLAEALVAGKYVVTNVRLLPGWAEKVVAQEWPRLKGDARAAAIRRLEGHYVYERELRTAMRYRVPCATCGGDVRECGHVGPHQEGRAVFVWDESHNDLNNRDYQGHGQDRDEREREKERRRLVVRWATQLRKLGFSGFLLSQHHENTDAQLRRVCNHIIRLQNQRNAGHVWIARLLPRRWTLFLVYWYPAHLADGTAEHRIKPVRFDRYFLPWQRHLYDSWETFHGVDDLDGEDAPILLPAGGRDVPPTLAGAAPRSGAPASAASVPSSLPSSTTRSSSSSSEPVERLSA